jgi:NTP pyrophosphatase (non-canonical NTP hydrolase)
MDELLKTHKEMLRKHITEDSATRAAVQDRFLDLYKTYVGDGLAELQEAIEEWRIHQGFETNWRNVPEKLMLVVSELGEAMEAYRHLNGDTLQVLMGGGKAAMEKAADGLTFQQFQHYDNFEEELADTAIRLLDLCGALNIDLAAAIHLKMACNEMRPRKHGKER